MSDARPGRSEPGRAGGPGRARDFEVPLGSNTREFDICFRRNTQGIPLGMTSLEAKCKGNAIPNMAPSAGGIPGPCWCQSTSARRGSHHRSRYRKDGGSRYKKDGRILEVVRSRYKKDERISCPMSIFFLRHLTVSPPLSKLFSAL